MQLGIKCLIGLALIIFFRHDKLFAQAYLFPIPESKGLTGTFGELRENHYHAGLDIRTFGKTGLPVLAAADGYIARVRIWYNGYGKAIYIKHPNGQSTVYAHLESLMPALDTFMYKKQMAAKQFNQEQYFSPREFPVKAGDLIGYSGNTGSSAGPHLHYEIRDAFENILNPLQYHKEHIEDYLAPFITRIAFEPLAPNARINGKYEKYIETPQNSEHLYFSKQTFLVKGKVGFEFSGYDRLVGAVNYNGVYAVRLWLDDTLYFSFQMDKFSFDEAKYIKQHVDYDFLVANNGANLQKCYLDRNNRMPIYGKHKNKGVLDLQDDLVHKLKLEVADYHGNLATYQAKIQRDTTPPHDTQTLNNLEVNKLNLSATVKRGILVVKSKPAPPTGTAFTMVYTNDETQRIKPTYLIPNANEAHTLIPLEKKRLPAYLFWGQDTLRFNFKQTISPETETIIQEPKKYKVYFGKNSVFDDVFLEVKETPSNNPMYCSPIYSFGQASIPLLNSALIRIYPNENAKKFRPEQLICIELKKSGGYNRFGVDINGNTQAKRLGNYVLIADTLAPTITPLNFNPNKKVNIKQKFLSFKVIDDVAEIDPWRVQIEWDGKWAIPEYYDYQNLLLFHFPQERGTHTLKVSITDHAGNKAEKFYTINLE